MKEPIHILLVEDDPDDLELLKVAFEESKTPFDFTVITQGHKVLSYLKESVLLPDIIVLDLNLPKTHGRDVLTDIKATDQFKILPIVILTTSSAKSDIDFCLANGADDYIVKPVTMAEYSTIVGTIIRISGKSPYSTF
jgi:DNA-binding response OmpR family regulator